MPHYLVFFFFFFSLANFGFIGTFNFVGEFLCFYGIASKSLTLAFFALFNIILSAAYGISLFNRVCFGSLKLGYWLSSNSGMHHEHFLGKTLDLSKEEFFVMSQLAFFTILFGVCPGIVIEGFNYC